MTKSFSYHSVIIDKLSYSMNDLSIDCDGRRYRHFKVIQTLFSRLVYYPVEADSRRPTFEPNIINSSTLFYLLSGMFLCLKICRGLTNRFMVKYAGCLFRNHHRSKYEKKVFYQTHPAC